MGIKLTTEEQFKDIYSQLLDLTLRINKDQKLSDARITELEAKLTSPVLMPASTTTRSLECALTIAEIAQLRNIFYGGEGEEN